MKYLATVTVTVEIESEEKMADDMVLWTAGTYANRPEAVFMTKMQGYGTVTIKRTARVGKVQPCS